MNHHRQMARIQAHYRTAILAGGLPAPNYPPANIASWIKICEDSGRSDLAKAIMDGWNKCWEGALLKYPKVRTNWPTAVVVGSNSVKKNVFHGDEFHVWLEKAGKLAPEQKRAAEDTKSITGIPAGTPQIAIPAADETPEQWRSEADKTKEQLAAAEQAFTNVDELIFYLEKEIKDISKKIGTYGPGGVKEKTKTGELSSYSARVPKWQEQLRMYEAKLQETQKKVANAEKNLTSAKEAYSTSPITTVKFEQTAQKKLMALTGRLSEIDRERETIIQEMQKLMSEIAGGKSTAMVTADLNDVIGKLIALVQKAWKLMSGWGDGVLEASHDFLDFATMRKMA